MSTVPVSGLAAAVGAVACVSNSFVLSLVIRLWQDFPLKGTQLLIVLVAYQGKSEGILFSQNHRLHIVVWKPGSEVYCRA